MDERTENLLKKQTRLQRTQVWLTVIILLIVVAAAALLLGLFRSIGNTVTLAAEKLEALDMDAVNHALDGFGAAAEQMSALDMEQVGDAISSLQTAAEKLGTLDLEQLNKLASAMEGTAEKLQGAADAISGLFNWR